MRTQIPPSSSVRETTDSDDPWMPMEQQVLQFLRDLKSLVSRYGETPQDRNVQRELLSVLASLGESVADMRFAFETAMEHPESFNIATDEMVRRSECLRSWEREVDRGKEVGARIRAATARPQDAQRDENMEEHNQFLRRELEAQRQITEVDDSTLDRMHSGIQRVRQTAQNIGDELEVQDHIIADIDTGMSRVQSRMESVMKKVGNLLDSTSDRGKIIIIVVLMVILILLIAFIV